MNIKAIIDLFKIKQDKNPRDWSKSDQVVLDNFKRLQEAATRRMQITPLNQSSYNDRRFSGQYSPDYIGPGEFSAGTKDKMPGTTPTQNPVPNHIKKRSAKGINKARLI
jgi:hypothetical protein